MTRLARLRAYWRSRRRAQVRGASYAPHAAVNLLPLERRPRVR